LAIKKKISHAKNKINPNQREKVKEKRKRNKKKNKDRNKKKIKNLRSLLMEKTKNKSGYHLTMKYKFPNLLQKEKVRVRNKRSNSQMNKKIKNIQK
jgi:hypothetical protein